MQLFMIFVTKKNGAILSPIFVLHLLAYTTAELATLPAAISPVFLMRTGM
jgi:hypothetical protein